jgi:hypothetical protein
MRIAKHNQQAQPRSAAGLTAVAQAIRDAPVLIVTIVHTVAAGMVVGDASALAAVLFDEPAGAAVVDRLVRPRARLHVRLVTLDEKLAARAARD